MEKLEINYHFIVNYYVTLVIIGLIASVFWIQNILAFPLYLFIVFILDFIPTLYIILNYLEFNSKTEVIFFDMTMTVRGKHIEKTIIKDQITQIFVFASPFVFKKRKLRFAVHESLFYVRIKLKDEEDIILTSLLRPNLYENIERIGADKIVKMKGLFNTIKK